MEKFSVKKPFTVLVAVIMVLMLGFVSISNMQTNLLPDVNTPYLMVVTVYPGASPERVESEVSDVMQNALGTVAGVEKVTATSAENYSLLLMQFSDDTDMNSALVKVSNKLDQAKSDLPSTCLTPSIIEYSLNMNAFMTVAVSREGADQYELSEFIQNTLVPEVQRKGGVSSVSSSGLVEKLVRKRLENYAKYRKMDATNYMRYVTDLIGIRGLLLYREDWVNFHKYITHWFKNDPEKYIRDYGRDYDKNASGYMAEPPKVHTRLGDYADIYVNWIPEENILDRKHYRAVHYIVVYRGVYIEIQIKTLFEEGWGEIDHSILYPRRKGNAMLTEFSELLNRLAGMGDEMGSFYRRLQVVPDEKFQSKETIVRKRELKPQVKAAVEKRDLNEIHTMDDAVWSILKE